MPCGTPEEQRAYQQAWRERNRDKLRDQNRAWREANPDRVRDMERRKREKHRDKYRADLRERKYGITEEDFNALWRKQDGKCAGCGKEIQPNCHVDHCHKTGLVRGLLCRKCNASLGMAEDEPEVLRRLAEYVEQAMVNSRSKGKRGELEFAAVLRDHGYEARRGVQYSGGQGSPDVVTNLPFHFEVKRAEQVLLEQWMSQAKRDAGDKVPIVAHKKNRTDWLVTMTATDFLNFVAGAKT